MFKWKVKSIDVENCYVWVKKDEYRGMHETNNIIKGHGDESSYLKFCQEIISCEELVADVTERMPYGNVTKREGIKSPLV